MTSSWTALTLAALTAGTGLAGVRYHAPPPNFAIPSAHGTHDLYDLRGRVVIIDFWATWCDACTAEMKYFAKAQQSFGDRLTVLTVTPDSPDVAATYLRFSKLAFPVVDDARGLVARAYSVSKIPVTLVLDPNGNVSYVSVGALSWDELRKAIEQASAAAPASTPSPGVLQ